MFTFCIHCRLQTARLDSGAGFVGLSDRRRLVETDVVCRPSRVRSAPTRRPESRRRCRLHAARADRNDARSPRCERVGVTSVHFWTRPKHLRRTAAHSHIGRSTSSFILTDIYYRLHTRGDSNVITSTVSVVAILWGWYFVAISSQLLSNMKDEIKKTKYLKTKTNYQNQ